MAYSPYGIDVPIEHRLIAANGIHLHTVLAGDPSAPLIVLLHGFPEFWYGWRKQIGALANAGFYVAAPDQRGYNLSSKPSRMDAYSLDILAADVVALIGALGRERAFVVGHDWGAAVAWHTAARHPTAVEKLAILNVPHPQVMSDTVRSSAEQMMRSWYIGFFQIPFLPEVMFRAGDHAMLARAMLSTSRPGTFTDADLAQYTQAWDQAGALTSMLNWYRAIVQRPTPPLTSKRITMPTLILWGVQDQMLSASMAERSLDYCDDGRLELFENATHWVQHEEPEAVNAHLIDHFRSTVSV